MRLIDGDVLLKDIRELLFTEEEPSMLLTEAGQMIHNSAIELALFEVVEAVKIDAVPVVHARWERINGSRKWGIPKGFTCYRCSACGREEEDNGEPYCHCGAKMDGGAENDH